MHLLLIVEHCCLRGDLADGQGHSDLVAELRGLRGKVTGHVEVEPAMDLGGQRKDFGSHGSTSCENPWLVAARPTNPGNAALMASGCI
jgi:hypothetical protein